MVEDSKVKKYPLRKKPLKPTNREWKCTCGHDRYSHNYIFYNHGWGGSDYDYNKCEICECPKYEADEKGGRWGI